MKKACYFDHAAATPLDKRVFVAMRPYFSGKFGNPSNLYKLGRDASVAIKKSSETISEILNCRLDEFVFTGSATEADNLAILGTARANKERGNKIIVSAVEHKGILAACNALEKEGFEIIKVPVLKNGLVDLNFLKNSLDEKTILVSITMADSETGTIQPISEISKIIKKTSPPTPRPNASGGRASPKERGQERDPNFFSPPLGGGVRGGVIPYFHTDASQAAGYMYLDVKKLNADLVTISAHKIYGPKGIAGLYIKQGTKIEPLIYGGGQNKLRSGTENVPGIVGFAKAFELIHQRGGKENIRIKKLRDTLEKGIFKSIPKVVLNGHPKNRLPNFLNISILDVEGEALLLYLDELGIMVATGSACNSQSLEPSYVLSALGNPYEFVHGSIRFTLGRENNMEDIKYLLKNLPPVVKKLREISPLNLKLNQKDKRNEKTRHSKSAYWKQLGLYKRG